MFFVLALSLTGLFLIFCEFFLPGTIMAIGGAVLLLASAFVFHIFDPRLFALIVYLAILLAASYLVIQIALWKVKSSVKNGLVSEGSQTGFYASVYPRELIGKVGIAVTDLKPSGRIRIDDRAFEALSEHGYIDKGTQVQILSGEGAHLVVTSLIEVK